MTRLYTARETSILYGKKNTAAAVGEVGNDLVRRRTPMLHGCGGSITRNGTRWITLLIAAGTFNRRIC